MPERYDILIRNTQVVDGTGAPAFTGSVGIVGEKIAAVGPIVGDAAQVIDGTGLVTCPGFVDPHSHADRGILDVPLAENLIMQGVTTFVGGNCGFSTAPVRDGEPGWRTLGAWMSAVEEAGLAPNLVPLVGHNALRRAVLGEDWRRAATPGEVGEMEGLVDEAMRDGAFGLSDGLDAAWPGHFADVDEIVALAKVAQAHGGLYTPHTRHHQNQWPAGSPDEFGYGIFHAPVGETIAGRYHGLLEAVEISRAANRIPLLIVHLSPAYLVPQPHPAFLDDALARATLVDIIDKPRDEGLDVWFNVIAWGQSIASEAPLVASFFDPSQMRPEWLRALDAETFVRRLQDPAFRDQVKAFVYSGRFKFRMMHPLSDPYWMDCIVIVRCANDAYVGRTIGELAREREPGSILRAVYDASLDVLFDLLVEDPETTCADYVDKREHGALSVFLAHPAGMPCTDVGAFPAQLPPLSGIYQRGVSPTAYGLFPHYLRTYVVEQGVLRLEEAVRKATSLPAREVLGIADRGIIEQGAYADLVVFDLQTLHEWNDYREPARPPEGIVRVLVNGTVVYDGQAHTGARPGRVLRHRWSR
jgi:N-acyl-D-aspartate/D-glutamate deacylase